jgi:DNA polymerase/3'-5' exonuclease PolX
VDHEEGLEYANEVTSLLFHYCMRIEPTGALRRRQIVLDTIEMLASPQIVEGESYWDDEASELAGEAPGSDRLGAGIRVLEQKGVLRLVQNQQPADASQSSGYGFHYREASIIVHTVTPPSRWGIESLLCTGDDDFVAFILRKASDKGFAIKRRRLERDGVAVDTPEEADVLNRLGVPWVEPENRNGRFLELNGII